MGGSPEVDLSSIDALTSLHRDLERDGIALWLAEVRAKARDLLDKSGVIETIGAEQVYPTVHAAKDEYLQK
jgi:MFS superfamily sulfate permease-like transporter